MNPEENQRSVVQSSQGTCKQIEIKRIGAGMLGEQGGNSRSGK